MVQNGGMSMTEQEQRDRRAAAIENAIDHLRRAEHVPDPYGKQLLRGAAVDCLEECMPGMVAALLRWVLAPLKPTAGRQSTGHGRGGKGV